MSAAAAAVEAVHITDVWQVLGGGPLHRGRGRAFWRDGDGYSVSVDDRKNVWYDFAQNTGGGLLALIQLVQGCDRQQALRWLVAAFALNVALDQPLTPAERLRFRRARSEAERFIAWRSRRLEELRDRRDFWLESYHRVLRKILTHSLNHHGSELWADACEVYERRYLCLETEIARFESGRTAELLPLFRAYEGRAA